VARSASGDGSPTDGSGGLGSRRGLRERKAIQYCDETGYVLEQVHGIEDDWLADEYPGRKRRRGQPKEQAPPRIQCPTCRQRGPATSLFSEAPISQQCCVCLQEDCTWQVLVKCGHMVCKQCVARLSAASGGV
jgi:hypothetical protein